MKIGQLKQIIQDLPDSMDVMYLGEARASEIGDWRVVPPYTTTVPTEYGLLRQRKESTFVLMGV